MNQRSPRTRADYIDKVTMDNMLERNDLEIAKLNDELRHIEAERERIRSAIVHRTNDIAWIKRMGERHG